MRSRLLVYIVQVRARPWHCSSCILTKPHTQSCNHPGRRKVGRSSIDKDESSGYHIFCSVSTSVPSSVSLRGITKMSLLSFTITIWKQVIRLIPKISDPTIQTGDMIDIGKKTLDWGLWCSWSNLNRFDPIIFPTETDPPRPPHSGQLHFTRLGINTSTRFWSFQILAKNGTVSIWTWQSSNLSVPRLRSEKGLRLERGTREICNNCGKLRQNVDTYPFLQSLKWYKITGGSVYMS